MTLQQEIETAKYNAREEMLVDLICKKLKKGRSALQIADEVEERRLRI